MTATIGHNSKHDTKQEKASQLDEVELLDGQVLLYRRPNSLVWQYRIRVSGQGKYVRKSTGTKNLAEAKQVATDAYFDIRANVRANIPVFTKTYDQLLDTVFEKYSADTARGKLGDKKIKDLNNQARLYYRRFLGNYQITSITQGIIDDFWEYRYHFWRKPEHQKLRKEFGINRVSVTPAKATLQMEKRLLDDVFKLAVSQGYLMPHQIPDTTIPVASEDVRRPAFTEKQIYIIREWLPVFAAATEVKKASDYRRKMLEPYVNVLLFTGMRVGAAKTLKWRDVEHLKEQDMLRFTVQGKPKKGQKRRIYYPACSYAIWTQYLEPWKKISKHTTSDDYVFADYDGTVCSYMDYQFGALQKFIEQTTADAKDYMSLSVDTFGDNLSLYSLRHSFATFQRRYFNRDWEALGTQMGTSSEMLRSHYVNIEPLEYSIEFAGNNGKAVDAAAAVGVMRDQLDELLKKMGEVRGRPNRVRGTSRID